MEHTAVSAHVPTAPSDNAEQLICRRIVANGVVIASLHPVLGPVYWSYYDNSDCNAPDSYSLTDYLHLATVFQSGHYQWQSFDGFLRLILDELSYLDFDAFDPDDEDAAPSALYANEVDTLARRAGCTAAAFYSWARCATWVEVPAPAKAYYLSDFNGHLGYRAVWSEDIGDALRFEPSMATSDDLGDMLARQIGDMVPVSQADTFTRPPPAPSGINHALEADVAFALFRLGLSRTGQQPRCLSYKDEAVIHAAMAGYERVVHYGDVGASSPHIAGFPMLLEAYEMAVSLARHARDQHALFISAEMQALAQAMLDTHGDWSPAADKLLRANRALVAYEDGAWIVDTHYSSNMMIYTKLVRVLPVQAGEARV